ncbi:hypothetical protein SEA_SKOG_99 [Gordonia phage Skog]|uniref:Uncharacterized protein n=1 Tax=Gordonia phage Skog TaxID=2704033 RepID=A0A6G6XJG4_9CAUD|nr:hypothetical protein KHQ85_gp099 [Gordonia phage Skog]QIG58251.1 hypothetical protein SEA_SKOG_99 [Gordonia phage Skog]
MTMPKNPDGSTPKVPNIVAPLSREVLDEIRIIDPRQQAIDSALSQVESIRDSEIDIEARLNTAADLLTKLVYSTLGGPLQ